MTELSNITTKEYGMKINMNKTKVMKIGKNGEVKVTIDGIELEQVKEFCYLGSSVTENMNCRKEISRRFAMRK